MNEITVREADASELRCIAHLKQQIHDLHVQGRPDLFAPINDWSAFEEHVDGKGDKLLLARLDDKPVGYALVRVVDRPANLYMQSQRFLHVEEFCVDHVHQRLGIGRALMDGVREMAARLDCPRITLDVWAFNEGAKQFYEAVGMKTYRYFMERDV